VKEHDLLFFSVVSLDTSSVCDFTDVLLKSLYLAFIFETLHPISSSAFKQFTIPSQRFSFGKHLPMAQLNPGHEYKGLFLPKNSSLSLPVK